MRTVNVGGNTSQQAENTKRRPQSLAGAIGVICGLLMAASSTLNSVSYGQSSLSAADIIDPRATVRAVFSGGKAHRNPNPRKYTVQPMLRNRPMEQHTLYNCQKNTLPGSDEKTGIS
ncbi:hypothetical protein SAMN05192553_101231 [Cyclobacterium xiamenense]|uniref:Uncharacterized protein n=1 Tax=Cyclobacterium xiamenense TaxID=1297121 RepID=A0A1H6TMP7_9BACT|nr:hypothetical protein SAMN05192553_101231 [Cyclobacterium xiamenense]